MEIKPTLIICFTLIRMVISKNTNGSKCWYGCGEREALMYYCGCRNLYSHFLNKSEGSKTFIKLSHDPDITLLDI